MAEKVRAGQGIGAWPVCGKRAGSGGSYSSRNTQGSSTRSSSTRYRAPQKQSGTTYQHYTKKHHTTQQSDHTVRTSAVGTGSYVVKSGDTLSKIAASHHVAGGWQAIWSANRGDIANPNLIFIGQRISL